jgi:hypothetical protein
VIVADKNCGISAEVPHAEQSSPIATASACPPLDVAVQAVLSEGSSLTLFPPVASMMVSVELFVCAYTKNGTADAPRTSTAAVTANCDRLRVQFLGVFFVTSLLLP